MQVVPYKNLSLGAKNSTVYWFKQLIDWSINGSDNISESDTTSEENKNKKFIRRIAEAELDQELYDLAVSLPESKQVSFEYLDSDSIYRYGRFTGSNVYKNFNGELDTSRKITKQYVGWVIIDRSSDKYCLFTNSADQISFIIAIEDFTSEKIISDFTPLYELLSKKYNQSRHTNTDPDDHKSSSLAVNEYFRLYIPGNKYGVIARDSIYLLWKIAMDYYTTINELRAVVERLEDKNFDALVNQSRSYDMLPQQLGTGITAKERNYLAKNSSALNDVQAIVYSCKDGNVRSDDDTRSDAFDMLFCFQQPDSIAYTAAASYEASSPRGSQIPFQFYQQANQIDLSFTLKWHADEAKMLSNGSSLNDIAEIAENFTRPWKSGNSIKPKLCKVILPSITKIGYMSSAAITFTGDMCGDLFNEKSGSGVLNGANAANQATAVTNTDYGYNQLEINFTLITINDVKLQQATDEKGTQLAIGSNKNLYGETITAENSIRDKVESGFKAAQMVASAAGSLVNAELNYANSMLDFVDGISNFNSRE